jgi:hypothetical protein
MAINTQGSGNKVPAGLFLRAKEQARSWRLGRSKKELISIPQAQAERQWAGLAEWLRAAHSLLDDKTAELAGNPE